MEFVLPLKLELMLDEPNDSRYWVQEFVNLDQWDEKRQSKQLEKIMKELFGTNEASLEIAKNFDILYSFIMQIEKVAPGIQEEVVNILVAAFNNLANLTEKEPLEKDGLLGYFKMYFVLVHGVFVKFKCFQSVKCLKVLNKALMLVKNLYMPDKPEDRLVDMVIEIMFAEIEKGKEDELCEIMKWVKDLEKSEVWEGWRAKAVNVLFGESENCVRPIVTIVKNEPSLVNELLNSLREAVLANGQVNETQGVKNVGLFIEKLSSKLPREMLMNISIIVNLLNCESYSLRNCIVTSIGEILVFIIKKDMDQSAERDTYTNYREQLLKILESRVMDKSSFCRARVLDAFITLTKGEDLLPRDWFLPVLSIASKRLLDCTVLVRRKATFLLENLIYVNKLIEGAIKMESQEAISSTMEKHKENLRKLELAQDGQFEDNTVYMEKEEITQQIIKTQILLKYLESYLDMTKILENSVKISLELLKSKNTSDVEGAIDVLVACNIRGVSEANEVASAMLSLICNSDPKVRVKVQNAFYNIYLNSKFNSEENCVQRMFAMIDSLNIGQLSSLESLFIELFESNRVSSEIKKLIWKRFLNEESYGASCILRFMAFSHSRDFLERRYEAFTTRALLLSNHWQIFRESLIAVQYLQNQGEKSDQFIYKAVHQLFDIKDSGWFAVAEQLIRTAASICERPLLVLKAIAIKTLKILFEDNNSEFNLAKVVFVGGEIAMKTVVYGEKVATEYKKKIDTSKPSDELEEIHGGKDAEIQIKLKNLKIDQENIVNEGLVSKFTPIILGFVKKLDEVKTIVLRKALVLSLAKLMCINAKLCEEYLPLLISIAKNNENEGIRSSAVISLGDLVMRHPNMLEQQSVHLFSLLTDECVQVRKKALLIISHLVLNDMLKMKGLMANIMKCYLDPELKGVVCVFIEELHAKDPKTIYNMIPDSISNLLKTDLTHNEFKAISDMIFAYITKEREGENLSERLSTRFKDSGKEECLNIGYCLSKLPWNEKAMKKLLENVSWWQNKLLEDPQLQAYFMDIATKCRRTWKSEAKPLIDEFEAGMRGEEEIVRKRKGRNN